MNLLICLVQPGFETVHTPFHLRRQCEIRTKQERKERRKKRENEEIKDTKSSNILTNKSYGSMKSSFPWVFCVLVIMVTHGMTAVIFSSTCIVASLCYMHNCLYFTFGNYRSCCCIMSMYSYFFTISCLM